MRHPNTMGAAEIEQFLTDMAVNGHVSASRQNQGFYALHFLYGQVLGIELPRIDAVRARRPKRLPLVLAPEEVQRLLDAVEGGGGVFRLLAGLCYGAGLRREESCQLRVQALDLARNQICVWSPLRRRKLGRFAPSPTPAPRGGTARAARTASSCCPSRSGRTSSASLPGAGNFTTAT
jgi:integrase